MNGSPNIVNTLSEAQAAESKGQYEKAFQCLAPFWDGYSQFPSAIGLSDAESAEMFMRFGSIVGFLGNSQKITNSQEISKNLLTQARRKFISLANFEKTAECENYLAMTYQRTGELTEAIDWLNESLSRNLPENHPTRINSYIIESVLDIEGGKYEKILRRCQELREIFEKSASASDNGSFHNNLAIAHKNLGNADEALKHLKLARDFFQKAKHEIYYGAVENNLAQLLHKVELFDEAHVCAENAIKIFEQIGDKMREGYSLETRAQIFAAEGKFDTALKFVNEAIELLEGGESYRNLVESYRTKVKILIQLNQLSKALTVMIAAHNIAALYISQELSKEIIEGVTALIQEKYESR
jgi:tetratricopeptide (TPR) repeat protein